MSKLDAVMDWYKTVLNYRRLTANFIALISSPNFQEEHPDIFGKLSKKTIFSEQPIEEITIEMMKSNLIDMIVDKHKQTRYGR